MLHEYGESCEVLFSLCVNIQSLLPTRSRSKKHCTVCSIIHLPSTTPMERRMMKGLLLPRLEPHLSEREPMTGVRKNPMSGDRHQIIVVREWSIPAKWTSLALAATAFLFKCHISRKPAAKLIASFVLPKPLMLTDFEQRGRDEGRLGRVRELDPHDGRRDPGQLPAGLAPEVSR